MIGRPIRGRVQTKFDALKNSDSVIQYYNVTNCSYGEQDLTIHIKYKCVLIHQGSDV